MVDLWGPTRRSLNRLRRVFLRGLVMVSIHFVEQNILYCVRNKTAYPSYPVWCTRNTARVCGCEFDPRYQCIHDIPIIRTCPFRVELVATIEEGRAG